MRKEETMKKILSVVFAVALLLSVGLLTLPVGAANPTTIASSTIYFESQGSFDLTDNGDGTYTGVIPCKVGAGFDIYGKEAATAWFGDDPGGGPVWTPETISDHDAWPCWDPDTPDWYQYSLNLSVEGGVQKWALRNHPSATSDHPWWDTAHWGGIKPAAGVPMSGYIEWYGQGVGYAYETDVGAYLPGTGTAEIPGGAASKGGGAQCWDMDWSWGSEVVPLEYKGFHITVVIGGSPDDVELDPGNPIGWETYAVSKIRVLAPWIAALGVAIAAGASLLMLRRRRTQT
jgi:hypothetical protein